MRVRSDEQTASDQQPAYYAGAIVIVAILALAAIRLGLVKGGN